MKKNRFELLRQLSDHEISTLERKFSFYICKLRLKLSVDDYRYLEKINPFFKTLNKLIESEFYDQTS